MDLEYFIKRFEQNKTVFEGLVSGMSREQATWKPDPDKWSIVEVVNHLYDEEREDFRQRLRLVLENTQTEWPRIDPRNWVLDRKYAERELEDSLNAFLEERDQSLEWLKQIGSPNWDNSHERPTGRLSAGDLLASWLAHDFLHIRQITRLHWQYVSVISAPYETTYAGPWRES